MVAFLYLISPESFSNVGVLSLILKMYHEYIYAFQLRLKSRNADSDLLYKISNLCKRYNVNFIVNDDVGMCLRCDCDGVHLGRSDGFSAKLCKNLIQHGKIIGVSCYDDINLGIEAAHCGASYVSFGAFFQSKTKPNAEGSPDSHIIQRFKSHCHTSVCVIGGITPMRSKLLRYHGADFVAVCSYIFDAKNPEVAVSEFLS